MTDIVVVDYGAGNLNSVLKGLSAVGARVRITAEPEPVADAAGVVVPGVGHFAATAALGTDWRRTLTAFVDCGRPLLGICLGMQWLFEGSDEAPDVPGLGLLPGRCRRLPGGVKVPHAGWNTLDRGAESRLFDGVPAHAWAYFTHSYVVPDDVPGVVATTVHGMRFASAIEHGVVLGTQYHPEKSGADGVRQLANFVEMARAR
jgi:glutamine amidotransferase